MNRMAVPFSGLAFLAFLTMAGCSNGIVSSSCSQEGRDYISKDPSRCATMRFKCDSQSRPFSDDCGCGCEQIKDRVLKNYNRCAERSRDAEACIQIYKPVCGWKQEPSRCFSPNCKSSFANSCFACSDRSVLGYTEGACPN